MFIESASVQKLLKAASKNAADALTSKIVEYISVLAQSSCRLSKTGIGRKVESWISFSTINSEIAVAAAQFQLLPSPSRHCSTPK